MLIKKVAQKPYASTTAPQGNKRVSDQQSDTKFWHKREMDFIDSIKDRIFADKSDFQKNFLDKMNGINQAKFYFFRCTESYVTIKCSTCSNFQLWFKFEGMSGDHAKSIRFFRKINIGHLKNRHSRAEISHAEE
jgi:hypothetical protein